jgi:hypothetical protein
MQIKFESVADLKMYLFLGRALLTVVSMKTKRHFTFAVHFVNGAYQVSFKTFNNNFDYLATLLKTDKGMLLRRSGRFGYKATPYIALKHLLGVALFNAEFPKNIEVYHYGKCGRCGRVITAPLSIKIGIGPECYKVLGIQGTM